MTTIGNWSYKPHNSHRESRKDYILQNNIFALRGLHAVYESDN